MEKEVKCPKCGSHLVFETFGQYGHIHKIGLNGKVHKRYKTVDYGGDDVITSMIYCENCGHDMTECAASDGITVNLTETEGNECLKKP